MPQPVEPRVVPDRQHPDQPGDDPAAASCGVDRRRRGPRCRGNRTFRHVGQVRPGGSGAYTAASLSAHRDDARPTAVASMTSEQTTDRQMTSHVVVGQADPGRRDEPEQRGDQRAGSTWCSSESWAAKGPTTSSPEPPRCCSRVPGANRSAWGARPGRRRGPRELHDLGGELGRARPAGLSSSSPLIPAGSNTAATR